MSGLFECHGHLMMDGVDFHAARERNRNGVDVPALRENLTALQRAGVSYFRDGGDAWGVSELAKKIAGEYGVDYASPIFAIHRQGYYGGIVGRAYTDMAEYRALVAEAKARGCDFIKIMYSGIITFDVYGRLSCPSLPEAEIGELVRIAHGEGLAVMAHVNGADAVRSALLAGTDSIEHGYFMEEDCLHLLAASQSIWVPTLAAIAAFVGREGVNARVAAQTLAVQQENVRRALALGAAVAPGSDCGAVGVPHGAGTRRELELLRDAGATDAELTRSAQRLQGRFRRGEM